MANPEAKRPVFLSWSGGKDSALALAALAADPDFQVVGVLTSITSCYDRVSVHGLRRAMLEEQLERLGLPLVEISLDPDCSNEAYESAFHEALRTIERDWPDVAHIAFGDLFLADVRSYRERLLEDTRFSPLFPVWGIDTTELANRFISQGHTFVFEAPQFRQQVDHTVGEMVLREGRFMYCDIQ